MGTTMARSGHGVDGFDQDGRSGEADGEAELRGALREAWVRRVNVTPSKETVIVMPHSSGTGFAGADSPAWVPTDPIPGC